MKHGLKRALKWTIPRIGLSLSLSLALGGGTSAGAQTLFFVPDSAADLSKYRTVDECVVAVSRTERSERWRIPLWPDTMELSKSLLLDSLSVPAQTVARRCVAKFHPDSVSVDDYLSWIQLYLQANRDGAADTVLQRRLSSASLRDSAQQRAILLKDVFEIYAEAHPVRLRRMLAVVEQIEQEKTSLPALELLSLYDRFVYIADRLNDTAIALRNAERAIATAATLTPEQKMSQSYRGKGSWIVLRMLDVVARRSLQDSLRRSATAYVALKQANWTKARGDTADKLPLYIGEYAKPIVADFWFAPLSSESTHSAAHSLLPNVPTRPTPGKASLLVFLRGGCHDDMGSTIPPERMSFHRSCWSTYAAIRRLAKRFPTLEITIVAQTAGNLAVMPPLTPKEEAQVMQKWWQGFHRLPGMLAVATTPFFFTPGLEHRRIDELTENNVNYTFGNNQEINTATAYLVDANGQIIYSNVLEQSSERDFRALLETLMSRVASGIGQGH